MPFASAVGYLTVVTCGMISIMYDTANYSNTKHQRGLNRKFTTRMVILNTILYGNLRTLFRRLSQTGLEKDFTDLNREEDLYTQRIEEDKKLSIDF